MSENFSVFWYLNENLFSLEKSEHKDIHNKFIDKVKDIQKKQKAIFIKEYFIKYEDDYLPSWILFEELTIWSISTVLNILKSEHCKNIALNYDTYYVDLRKWLNLLVQVRNISAHHSRLWNNNYIIRPRIEDVIFKNKFLLEEKNNIKEVISNYYNTALILNYLLKHINKNLNLHWLDNIKALFNEFELVKKEKMWFIDNREDNFWQ